MEKYVTMIISFFSLGLALLSLVLTRIDKAKKDGKDDNLAVIVYQIKDLKEDIGKLSDKLDRYEKEEDDKINKAIVLHERLYHGRGANNDKDNK